MIKVSILYPNGDDIKLDMDYYLNKHMPLAGELLGDAVKSVSVDYGLSGALPDEKPAFVVMTSLVFESLEAFQNAFALNAEKLMGDLANFTNTTPQIQISEIKI